MRASLVALTLPLLALAACGAVSENALSLGPPAPPVAPPTQTDPQIPASQAHLFDVTADTKFAAIGAAQSLSVDDKGSTLYAGNAGTVAAPTGTITYNPRDGIFTVNVADPLANVTRNVRFQDPAHRATADSARVGEYQVPLLAGFNYLQALESDAQLTFFYQRPAAAGSFASVGGFERSKTEKNGAVLSEQGAFVFGTKTPGPQTPTRGTGRFEGEFLATMAGNRGGGASMLQWINGTSAADVDFARRTVGLSLNGVVGPAYVKDVHVGNDSLSIPSGATFSATGSASWVQAGTADFAGAFTAAGFSMGSQTVAVDFTAVNSGNSVAGASSIDGTFYGPDAKNIGGSFRITGGVPDQRVDILGAFAGSKK